jgi:formylglycine-generating enzyme required for sulfatase activity
VQTTGGEVELRKTEHGWTLRITPAGIAYTTKGETLVYADRGKRSSVAWKRLPVSGITADDAKAYAAWLADTGKVPNARLCTELEWERGARGPDGRPYPGGERLAPDDANFDETYGRKDGGFGPDEVGAHAASDSPFGLHDTAGNVWEIVQAPNGFAMRGGGYYTGAMTAHLANRQEIPPSFKHLHVGVRLCAD